VPLLALDASARVRTVYDCWQQGRGGIVMLPKAMKRYERLAIHVWQRGGGKSAFRSDARELVEGIASAIMTRPDEEWLVVHHKPAGGLDFEAELRARLGMFCPTVHYLHWCPRRSSSERPTTRPSAGWHGPSRLPVGASTRNGRNK
jgi:hypothetical protein